MAACCRGCRRPANDSAALGRRGLHGGAFDDKVVEVRAYLDSEMVQRLLDENPA
jgi:hypothetical protein